MGEYFADGTFSAADTAGQADSFHGLLLLLLAEIELGDWADRNETYVGMLYCYGVKQRFWRDRHDIRILFGMGYFEFREREFRTVGDVEVVGE